MNTEEIIYFLKSIVWGQILPWLGIIWTLVLFFGWGRRKMQRENEKLRLEIEKLKKEDSRIYLPTPDEVKAVLNKTDRFLSKWDEITRGRSGRDADLIEVFGGELYSYLKKILESYNEIMQGKTGINDPEPLYKKWVELRSRSSHADIFDAETIQGIDLLLSLLMKARDTYIHTNRV